MIILKTLHSALSVSVVANAPAPAISGKITGTIVAEPSGPSFLKISILKVISMASTKSTNAPAWAKEEISMLNNFNNPSPAKRNAINITRDIPAAFSALTFFPESFNPMIMVVDPAMSITAKSTIKAVNISFILILKSIFILHEVCGLQVLYVYMKPMLKRCTVTCNPANLRLFFIIPIFRHRRVRVSVRNYARLQKVH